MLSNSIIQICDLFNKIRQFAIFINLDSNLGQMTLNGEGSYLQLIIAMTTVLLDIHYLHELRWLSDKILCY
jgi:hypothetical protein